MSRRKAFVPSTYTPGYKLHRNADGTMLLHSDPSKPHLFGKPVVTLAKPFAQGLHFANHAARLRVAERAGCSTTDDEALKAAIPAHAEPKDLVKVGYLRGLPGRFANEVRADMRRMKLGKSIFPGEQKKAA